ncbi:MAG: DNA repair protein RadA, partial [Sulfuricurvum sp. 24-42-5]
MAKKKTTLFECQHCGFTTPKWMGKCTNCGGWDCMIELNEQQQDIVKLVASSSPLDGAKAQEITKIE